MINYKIINKKEITNNKKIKLSNNVIDNKSLLKSLKNNNNMNNYKIINKKITNKKKIKQSNNFIDNKSLLKS